LLAVKESRPLDWTDAGGTVYEYPKSRPVPDSKSNVFDEPKAPAHANPQVGDACFHGVAGCTNPSAEHAHVKSGSGGVVGGSAGFGGGVSWTGGSTDSAGGAANLTGEGTPTPLGGPPTSGSVVDREVVDREVVHHEGDDWAPCSSLRLYLPSPEVIKLKASATACGGYAMAIMVDGEVFVETKRRFAADARSSAYQVGEDELLTYCAGKGWHTVTLVVTGNARVYDRKVSWSVISDTFPAPIDRDAPARVSDPIAASICNMLCPHLGKLPANDQNALAMVSHLLEQYLEFRGWYAGATNHAEPGGTPGEPFLNSYADGCGWRRETLRLGREERHPSPKGGTGANRG
jgi:hypothetical protein